jgi:hypothetical protein
MLRSEYKNGLPQKGKWSKMINLRLLDRTQVISAGELSLTKFLNDDIFIYMTVSSVFNYY